MHYKRKKGPLPKIAAELNVNYVVEGSVTRAGNRLTGTSADDLLARFNSSLGQTGCLTGIGWYYGLDANQPPNRINRAFPQPKRILMPFRRFDVAVVRPRKPGRKQAPIHLRLLNIRVFIIRVRIDKLT